MSSRDHEAARDVSRRRFAKAVVVALGIAGFAGAGLSGALASHGSDDGVDFSPSGGSAASGGSGSGGWEDDWEDDWVFLGSSGGSGGSGGSGWDDDWGDD